MKFWCSTAFMSSPQLPAVARMLDESGYHGAVVSDHLVYPKELKSAYPYSPFPDGRPIWDAETAWPDSWVLIGAMAAVTERLQFTNSIYIAGARPLLQVAKQVATASVLSGGRVGLGVGAGWMREEFELMGQSFENRGPRLNEMIEALRALWAGGWVEWHGKYYEIPPLMMEPHPQEPVPIYCGGHTDAALKRAARYGDGWIGNAYPWDEVVEKVGRLKGYLKEYGRENNPFEIVVGFYEPPSVDLYRRAEDEVGVTGTMTMPWAGMEDVSTGEHAGLRQSADRFRGPIERFAEDIVSKCG